MTKLILVPTPIGNLKDITLRAIDTLQEVDGILAEDTRVSLKLMQHFNIQKPLVSFHKFNEHKKLEEVIGRLKGGETMAMISDAGTPGISDPAFLLVRACLENDIPVETLPGPVAFVPALVNSGLPCDRFVFEGFLPQKKGRLKRLTELSEESRTMVFYESPYRVLKTFQQFQEHFGGDRNASFSREISKMFEETFRGSIQDIIKHLEKGKIKGEFTLIVQGKNKKEV